MVLHMVEMRCVQTYHEEIHENKRYHLVELTMLIVSFDVGIVNLAIVVIRVVPEEWGLPKHKPSFAVLEAWHIDITQETHDSVSLEHCTLYHTKELSDRILHVIQEYEPRWSAHGCIDRYLIERQPPQGLTGIEEILFQKFREKMIKVSPNAMHAWLKLSPDYETRKAEVVRWSRPFLAGQLAFDTHERNHDMADATCLAAYQIHQWAEAARQERMDAELQQRFDENIRMRHQMSMDAWFDTFRYDPNT